MVIRRESAFSRRIVSENTLTVQIVLYILMKRGEDVLETLQKYPNQKLCEKFEFQNIAQEDIKEAALLEQICFPPNEACTEERMAQRIQKAPELFLTAAHKGTGKIAGFINGISTEECSLRDEFFTDIRLHNPEGRNVMILGVAVHPEHQGQGLAGELMRRYLSRMGEMGKSRIFLTCVSSKVKMYQKMGFYDQGRADSLWGGHFWHEMSCEIFR